MPEPKPIDTEALREGSSFYHQQLEAEAFKMRVRRDAKSLLETEEALKSAPASIEEIAQSIYAPLPPDSPELIPGLLPQAGTAAIVGETESGKSLIALEMCSSLVTGEPLWGSIIPNKTLDKIVYILGEHTCSTIQGLFHRTRLPHSGNILLIGPEHLHPHKALVIGGNQQKGAMERMLRWTEGASLIVFDPLAGFAQGLNTEQDNSAMRTLIDSMSTIAQLNGAACLILSHMGKPRMDESGAEIRRTSYAMRGASSQEDALTHVFYLRSTRLLKSQRDTFELSVRKFKGNPSKDAFRLERDPETKRHSLIPEKDESRPSFTERMTLGSKVMRLKESKPSYSDDTCIEVVAAVEGIPKETLKRWLSGSV